ncbi:LexA family transcriptional regulator [Streptomyces mirabilis]|uniref:hypothetical protein n=1 Tax=Streptomyces mirabilis TaxID=68239 RepID=UPI0036825A6C
MNGSQVHALTSITGFILGVQDVQEIMRATGNDLYRGLAVMDSLKYTALESVYGASRRSPVARVARLIRFLAVDVGAYEAHDRDGDRIVRIAPQGLVEGPTQADLADALALGRATVEKSLVTLREKGALRAAAPGERTNRFYLITDKDLLEHIGRGA